MIANTTNLRAIFDMHGHRWIVPVLAWGPGGEAMAADPAGRLVGVTDVDGFVSLQDTDPNFYPRAAEGVFVKPMLPTEAEGQKATAAKQSAQLADRAREALSSNRQGVVQVEGRVKQLIEEGKIDSSYRKVVPKLLNESHPPVTLNGLTAYCGVSPDKLADVFDQLGTSGVLKDLEALAPHIAYLVAMADELRDNQG